MKNKEIVKYFGIIQNEVMAKRDLNIRIGLSHRIYLCPITKMLGLEEVIPKEMNAILIKELTNMPFFLTSFTKIERESPRVSTVG